MNSCAGCGPPLTSRWPCGTTNPDDVLSARHIEIAREAGVLAVLPTALTTRVVPSLRVRR